MKRYWPLLLLMLLACSPLRPQIVQERTITGAEVWQGKLIINGSLRVARGGSLTLLPGTELHFVRRDTDGDGIGDAELLVEGELIAKGTATQPILLTSAEQHPQVSDWKYLYLDYARKVEIDYLVSEYAYSGIQMHFCRAKIEHSEFRYNVDGVRFSTANIELQGSELHHNRHGIRFEERGGRGVVRNNRLHDNQIGIFAVTRGAGRTNFRRNDIFNNRPYQVKLGLQQATSLDFPQNWWGDVRGLDPLTVFDQSRDPSLGRVTGSDPLTHPIAESVSGRKRLKESTK